MTPEQLETVLVAWGHAFGERKPSEWDEPHGCSPMARIQKPRRQSAYTPVGRAGGRRLRLMGAAAGLVAENGRTVPVPDWAVDSIPCVETRNAKGYEPPDPRVTTEVERAQSAWLVLVKWWPLRAEVLRLQYQVRGMTQREKAETMGDGKDGKDLITVIRYRDELAAAKVWMQARLAA